MLSALIAVLFLFLGLFLRSQKSFPIGIASKWVNNYLFYLVLPALALLYIPSMEMHSGLLIPISAAWFTFLLSWLIFGLLGKYLNWGRNMTGCLIIVAGLANTSFMGFPVIEFVYGKEGLPTAFLMDQGGSFLLVSSLSIVVGSIYSEKEGDLRRIPLKIISFPPFLFLVLSVMLSLLHIKLSEGLVPLLELVGMTMAPMALLAIGLRLSLDLGTLRSRFFWQAMSYRLIFAPLLVWMIYGFWLDRSDLEFKVMVLESGMAPMITGSIVAIQYDLNPKLASQLAGLGMPIAVISLALWYFFLGV